MDQRSIFRFVFTFFISFLATCLLAQENLVLAGFIGKASDEKILLQWTINSGQSCNGTTIERSEDTVNFRPIGEIAGICGNSATPVPYFFTDESPISNKFNFYRLELGGQGYSKILAIPYFEYGNTGSIIIPNPASDYARVYFENNTGKPCTFSLKNASGKMVRQFEDNSSTIYLDLSNIAAGNYYYSIQQSNRPIIKGKLIRR
jgi:hypothetical protein